MCSSFLSNQPAFKMPKVTALSVVKELVLASIPFSICEPHNDGEPEIYFCDKDKAAVIRIVGSIECKLTNA